MTNLVQNILESEIVSLAYNDPRIKVKTIQAIVFECLNSKQQVHYLDFDLQFSSMLQNLSKLEFERISKLDLNILQPSNNIEDPILTVQESNRNGGLVVIDSLNTLQNLFSVSLSLTDAKTANHRATVLVSLIQQLARFYSKSILILSLTKMRPKKSDVGVTWEREIVGGRMTRFKSDAVLFATEEFETESKNQRIKVEVDTVSSDMFEGRANDVYEILVG
ncbi:MAG TPA: hypothetical protein VNE86_02530 [Nitrososphaerales archaeon]|nr:hypothetical protein [Nitrososphaerales archaeon]